MKVKILLKAQLTPDDSNPMCSIIVFCLFVCFMVGY